MVTSGRTAGKNGQAARMIDEALDAFFVAGELIALDVAQAVFEFLELSSVVYTQRHEALSRLMSISTRVAGP